jgi:hypothetical protein
LIQIAAMIGLTWQTTRGTRSWEVSRMTGQPRIGSALLAGTGRLGVGQTLVTDAASRARLDVSTIGQATVDTDSRVRLVDTREGHHKLALERGTLHAFITAPPGQFVVDHRRRPRPTSAAVALHVDEDGTALSVTAGWLLKRPESFSRGGQLEPIRVGQGRHGSTTPRRQAALAILTTAPMPRPRRDPSRSPAQRRGATTLWHHRAGVADRAPSSTRSTRPCPPHARGRHASRQPR